jgi:hypothetical protein
MLEHGELPDPVGQTMANLNERLALLEAEIRVRKMESPDPMKAMPGG